MNVAQMRRADRRLGLAACRLLTLVRRLGPWREPPPGRPRKLLFVKLAEQGSTVLAYPTLRAAVERFGAENVYFLALAENRAVVDLLGVLRPENVVTIEARGGVLRAALGAVAALRRLRNARIDAAIDLEFFARSTAALAYLSGARWRVGYHVYGPEAVGRGDLMTHRLSFNPYLHTSQAFRVMLEALDHPPGAFPRFDHVAAPAADELPRFRPDAGETDEVRRTLAECVSVPPRGRVVLLNANASDLIPVRRWEPQRYVDLARRLLAEDPTLAVAFTGAPAEAKPARALADAVGSPRCGSVAGRTTLRQLLVLYTLADVLVTNDSGPAHFAALTPVNVVVLFGPETPRLFAAVSPRTRPLWAGLACSPCVNAFNDRHTACRDNACMQALTVEQVHAAVRDALAGRRPLPLAA
jgi:ADP-heptose:LPS heptosyltransferase